MKNIIFRISRNEFEALKTIFEEAGENETQAFVLCTRAESKNETIFIAKNFIFPGQNDFEEKSPVSIVPTAEFQASAYGLGYDLGLSVFDVHTHPFFGKACLSPTDYRHGKKNAKSVSDIYPSGNVMGMVVFNRSMDSFEGVVWNQEKNDFDYVDNLEILGSPIQILPEPENHRKDETYARHRIIPGWNQNTLGQLKVIVAGLGGNGALVFQSLLCLGVGENGGWIQACDSDVVEESNLSRIPYAESSDVGKSKAVVAEQYALKKCISVHCHEQKAEGLEDIAKEAHILIGAVDSEGCRKFLNSISNRYLIPYIDISTEIIPDGDQYKSLGQVHAGIPGQTGCLMCSGLIDVSEAAMDHLTEEQNAERKKAGYVRETNETPTPSVIHLNGIACNLAIAKMIDLIFGKTPENGFLNYCQNDYSLLAASDKPNPDCPVCGRNGYLGDGDEVLYENSERAYSAHKFDEIN